MNEVQLQEDFLSNDRFEILYDKLYDDLSKFLNRTNTKEISLIDYNNKITITEAFQLFLESIVDPDENVRTWNAICINHHFASMLVILVSRIKNIDSSAISIEYFKYHTPLDEEKNFKNIMKSLFQTYKIPFNYGYNLSMYIQLNIHLLSVLRIIPLKAVCKLFNNFLKINNSNRCLTFSNYNWNFSDANVEKLSFELVNNLHLEKVMLQFSNTKPNNLTKKMSNQYQDKDPNSPVNSMHHVHRDVPY